MLFSAIRIHLKLVKPARGERSDMELLLSASSVRLVKTAKGERSDIRFCQYTGLSV